MEAKNLTYAVAMDTTDGLKLKIVKGCDFEKEVGFALTDDVCDVIDKDDNVYGIDFIEVDWNVSQEQQILIEAIRNGQYEIAYGDGSGEDKVTILTDIPLTDIESL